MAGAATAPVVGEAPPGPTSCGTTAPFATAGATAGATAASPVVVPPEGWVVAVSATGSGSGGASEGVQWLSRKASHWASAGRSNSGDTAGAAVITARTSSPLAHTCNTSRCGSPKSMRAAGG